MKEIPQSLVEAMQEHLGSKGTQFFKDCVQEYGTVSPVIPSNPPHPVHFREGMRVRNFMRKRPECEGWTDIELDDNWMGLVASAIGEDQ